MKELPPDPQAFPPFEIARSESIYRSPWCQLRRDELRLEQGALQEHHVFEVAPAVCVVPVLRDGSIAVLWHHRHTHGRSTWEIPAGRIDTGETPAEAAARELLEETGHAAERVEQLARFYPLAGICPQLAYAFVAHDAAPVSAPEPEPGERLRLHVLSRAEVEARLRRGDFEDGFAALALLHYFLKFG